MSRESEMMSPTEPKVIDIVHGATLSNCPSCREDVGARLRNGPSVRLRGGLMQASCMLPQLRLIR